MKYLFSDTGRRLLESLTFTRALYAFDFDGTLAPIVSHPADAVVPVRTGQLISALNKQVTTAVISGRSVDDLKERVSWKSRYMIGNHGLEGLPSRLRSPQGVEKTCLNWKQTLERLWKRISDPGVFIEDKRFSLALHFRKSRQKREMRRRLLEIVSDLDPAPRLILGKSVINLLPVGAPHKGVAIQELMLHLGVKSALYIGDDDTDEDVFSLPDSRILSVRVGYKKNSQAQFFLKRQSEVNRVLMTLSGFLGGKA